MIIFSFRKSYGYAIQAPVSDSKPDDTKYKFDYALQRPAEEKSDEPEQRTMYTKVDRVTQDKHGKHFKLIYYVMFNWN